MSSVGGGYTSASGQQGLPCRMWYVICGMWIQVVISEFQNVDKTEIEFQPNIMKEAGVHKKQHDRQRNMRTNVRSIVLCGA